LQPTPVLLSAKFKAAESLKAEGWRDEAITALLWQQRNQEQIELNGYQGASRGGSIFD
jgi:hypothetical protein